MSPSKSTYAAVGVVSALLALVVDQLLWLRFPLYFAFGLPIAFLSPFVIAGIGSFVGWRAMGEHGRNFGLAIITTNVLAAVLGIWWALDLQPQAFGGSDPSQAIITGLQMLAQGSW